MNEKFSRVRCPTVAIWRRTDLWVSRRDVLHATWSLISKSWKKFWSWYIQDIALTFASPSFILYFAGTLRNCFENLAHKNSIMRTEKGNMTLWMSFINESIVYMSHSVIFIAQLSHEKARVFWRDDRVFEGHARFLERVAVRNLLSVSLYL